MLQPKIWIISSVPENAFANLDFTALGFDSGDEAAAKMPEIDLFLNTLDEEYRRALTTSGIKFEIIRAMNNDLPKHGEYGAFLLWGAQTDVRDRARLPWVEWLIQFVHREVNSWTPVLGMCFWHQVLVTAFWWKVVPMDTGRKLWPSSIMLNADGKWDEIFWQLNEQFTAMYSHRQSAVDPWEAKVLWSTSYDKHTIVKVGEHAWWVQYHPEFTSDTISFLAKLMHNSGVLQTEWLDMKEIIWNAKAQAAIEGAKTIQLFLKKYWNK